MAQIFWKLLTPKDVLPWIPKSSCFRTPYWSQRVHRSQTLLKSARHYFYPNFTLIQGKLSCKIYLWIRSKMLGLFVNTLTAHHMYSAHSCEQIPQQVQKQLYFLKKHISQTFIAFLKSTWNFAHLEKKDQLDSSNICEVIDSKTYAYLNAKKLLFGNTLLQSTCSRIPNTAQICEASLLS